MHVWYVLHQMQHLLTIPCTIPWLAACGLRGCKNRAHSVSWPEVVKAVPNQGVDCFVSWGSFFCFSFVFLVYVVLCLIVFGCQYQCNWLPAKTRLQNDLLCVEWDVKPYTLTHSLTPWLHCQSLADQDSATPRRRAGTALPRPWSGSCKRGPAESPHRIINWI